jgi:hypothetical protein
MQTYKELKYIYLIRTSFRDFFDAIFRETLIFALILIGKNRKEDIR